VEGHVLGNGFAAAIVALLLLATWRLRASPFWRERLRDVVRRRPIATLVVALYLGVALLDSVAWRDAPAGQGAAFARSLLDRLFPADFREKSYSAPLADVEFYGGAPLAHPGRHLLGTDILGRDVLHLALGGARVALLIGGLTSLIAIPLAILLGLAAGYFGGRVDDAVFFLLSTLASMPSILLLVALIMVMGRGPMQVCVALAVTSWVNFCRVVRGETLKLRELDYVQAARALGVSELRIVWHHVLPNLSHLVAITFVLTFSQLVLSEAILSWLGVGIEGSWGQMIDQARDELARDPIIGWNLAAASVALFTLILAVNRVGDAVRDVLDPRTLRERA
jgi:peptide/nickel transport system permease protein